MRRNSILGLGFIPTAAACGGGSVGGGDSDDPDTNPDGPDADPFQPDADIVISRPDADPNAPDAAAEPPLDFENNLLPSPMPPGDLDPKDAPMIIVFGWDDIAFTGDHAGEGGETDNGMNFIAKTFGNITNPDGDKGSITFYENGAYLPNGETGGPWGSETNLMLAAGQELIAKGFEVGNHTFDHLETNGTWGKIPAAFKNPTGVGWKDSVGTLLDVANWKSPVIGVNDALLRQSYSVEKIFGFRAPLVA